MRAKRGFLLLELLLAAVILCIAGTALSRSFSKEIEMTGISSELELLHSLAGQKLFDVEHKLRAIQKEEQLETLEENGEFKDHPGYEWSVKIKPITKIPGLYELNLTIEGLKRNISLIKLFNFSIAAEEEQTEADNET